MNDLGNEQGFANFSFASPGNAAVFIRCYLFPAAHCGSVAVADELHMIFECPALQAVRQRYAPLFSTDTNTMRSFFAQQDHMQVFKFVLDCLDVFHI